MGRIQTESPSRPVHTCTSSRGSQANPKGPKYPLFMKTAKSISISTSTSASTSTCASLSISIAISTCLCVCLLYHPISPLKDSFYSPARLGLDVVDGRGRGASAPPSAAQRPPDPAGAYPRNLGIPIRPHRIYNIQYICNT